MCIGQVAKKSTRRKHSIGRVRKTAAGLLPYSLHSAVIDLSPYDVKSTTTYPRAIS